MSASRYPRVSPGARIVRRDVGFNQGGRMLRDELIKALEAQPHDTDVQLKLGDYLLAVRRVDFDEDRGAIVLDISPEDLDELIYLVTRKPWWRGRQRRPDHNRGAFDVAPSER